MDRDEFFQNIFGENTPSAEIIRAQRQLAYEERIIKRILTGCDAAPGSWGMLVNQCRRESHSDKLNFEWFNTHYTKFPGKLCGKRIPFLHQITLPDLFRPVVKNKLVKAIGRVLGLNEINPHSQNFVCVFPIVKTQFCAYNSWRIGQEVINDTARTQIVLSPELRNNRPLIIEPLATYCKAVGNDWVSAD